MTYEGGLPEVPERVVVALRGVHGERGERYLHDLPARLHHLGNLWGLTILGLSDRLSYSIVYRVRTHDGEPAILKLRVPDREAEAETRMLQVYGGRGAVRLLRSAPDEGALLLEELLPGISLASEDEETALCAFCAVWRTLETQAAARLIEAGKRSRAQDVRRDLPTLADWGRAFERYRDRFGVGRGPLPVDLFEQGERVFHRLDGTTAAENVRVLHGDLHHGNILRDGRSWRAIDPKGVVGDRAYEVLPFLREGILRTPRPARALRRRLNGVCRAGGLDPRRVAAWGIGHSVLSAVWSVEDHAHGWEEALEWARLFAAYLDG